MGEEGRNGLARAGGNERRGEKMAAAVKGGGSRGTGTVEGDARKGERGECVSVGRGDVWT